MRFTILSDITEVETIALNRGIREVARLRKQYGRGRWRKRKGSLQCCLPMEQRARLNSTGTKPLGLDRKEYKIKRFLD
jgi:hypothetical protein